jgi:hypothetical protein
MLREPYALFAVEGIDLRAAAMLAQGRSPYLSSHDPAFLCYSYPILHPALGAALIRLGLQPFFALRLIGVVSELLTITGAAVLIERIGGDRTRSILSAGLLSVLFSTHGFHATARVDFLMLAAVTWAVAFLERFLAKDRPGDALACALLFLVAPLAKQTALISTTAALAYAGLVLLRRGPGWRRPWRLLTPVLAAQLLHGLVIFALDRWSAGEYVHGAFRDPSLPAYSLSQTWLVERFLRHFGSLVLVALGTMMLPAPGLIRALLFTSATTFAVNSFRYGGDMNYALELIVWLVVTIGVARLPPALVARLSPGTTERAVLLAGATVLAASSALHAGIAVEDIFASRLIGPIHGELRAVLARIYGTEDPALVPERALDLTSEAASADRRAIDRLVREAPGMILAEEPSFVVLEGRTFEWGTDLFLAETLAERGLFDQAALTRGVAKRRYERVFVGHRLRRVPGLMKALASGYHLVFQTRTPIAQSFLSVYDANR